jgi:hypothetical protein
MQWFGQTALFEEPSILSVLRTRKVINEAADANYVGGTSVLLTTPVHTNT